MIIQTINKLANNNNSQIKIKLLNNYVKKFLKKINNLVNLIKNEQNFRKKKKH